MHSASVHVFFVTSILVLIQQTIVVAKLVTGTKGAIDERAVQSGVSAPVLPDLPEHLEYLVRDTSEESEMLKAQDASMSKKLSGKLKGMQRRDTEDVRENLINGLVSTFRAGPNSDRLMKWEAAIAPMFVALPKNAHGNLGHAAAKYALHRAFVQQHSWSMSGLEPTDATWNSSSPSGNLHKWVPEYMLGLIEELLGTKGINLQELSVLAALFEDLAHKEAIKRLAEIFETLSLPSAEPIDQDTVQHVVKTYMTIYTSANGLYAKTVKDVMELGLSIDEETQAWLEEIQRNIRSSSKRDKLGARKNGTSEMFDFAATTSIVEEIGERFGSFNDRECRALKSILLGMENRRKVGRVALSDFYKEGMTEGYWQFNEKVDYLRILGALDESDSAKPQLIIPNYISSRTNCIVSSSFYAVCCQNECEDLLGQLESKIRAPLADAKEIAEFIASIPSDTIKAPRELSATLLLRLEEIAQTHNGKVPLHGRMFAQWMHHAFPRECPYPHQTDENPQTPDEWIRESGSIKASKDEMLEHIHNGTMRLRVTLSSTKEENMELPWNSVEQLIDEHHTSILFNVDQTSSMITARWRLQCGFLIAVFVLVLAFMAVSRSFTETDSYLKKYDSEIPSEHGWHSQGHAQEAFPMNLKQRHKIEAPSESYQFGV